MDITLPFYTFPPISWWASAASNQHVLIHPEQRFQKMQLFNRYRISGSNNPILLTVPLVQGREQNKPIAEISIFNGLNWQVQHWRTLVSVYRRAPYWEYYEHLLAKLYEQPYQMLADFNRDCIGTIAAVLKLPAIINYPSGPPAIQSRNAAPEQTAPFPRYYQLFEDRIGFQENLSILDLILSEGPRSLHWLQHEFDNAK
ncbi:MAG: hypothetical protein EBZ77_05055 [Chitinophagia bacterium]|nr:hypothetical protein [Chitinophagia bacterium]